MIINGEKTTIVSKTTNIPSDKKFKHLILLARMNNSARRNKRSVFKKHRIL